MTSSTPANAPMLAAVRSLSPVIITTRRPRRFRPAMAAALSSLIGSDTAATATARPAWAMIRTVLPSSANWLARAVASASVMPCSAIKAGLPITTGAPSNSARTPPPVTAVMPLTVGRFRPASLAAATMALAIGCSDPASTAAQSASRASCSPSPSGVKSVRTGLPCVIVPVLSSATVLIPLSACRASPLRNRTPIPAARPVPTTMEVGVARPIAQGQAMIRTDTIATTACDRPGPTAIQTAKVSAARAMIVGTNHRVMRSTRPWIGRRAPCASWTMRTIWDRAVSAPTWVASIRRAPEPFNVPPVTGAPRDFRIGMGSPLSMLSSTWLSPSRTVPSTGRVSPGRTNRMSPA